jgi:hypothetical protein
MGVKLGSLASTDELKVLENRVLMIIFGPNK